jgi:hypothetical protein
MVSALRKPVRVSLLLLAAVLAPFVLLTAYIVARQGHAFHSHFLHRASEFIMILSGVPFIAALPIQRWTRATIAIAFVIVLFFTIDGFGFLISCAFGWCV